MTPAQRAALDALPPKRRAFVLEYLRTGNATEAARRAGYSHPKEEGVRLLSFAAVRSAIEAFRAPAEESEIASVDELRRRLTRWLRNGVIDADGGALLAMEPKDVLKALELLGKSQGAFVERREVRVTEVPATKEEALARLEALRAKLGGSL